MNCDNMEVNISFKYLGSNFNKDRGIQKYLKMRVGEPLKTFGAVKVCNVRNIRLGVKKELSDIAVVLTVTYGAEIQGRP